MKKYIIITFIFLAVIISGFFLMPYILEIFDKDEDKRDNDEFDPGDRYDSKVLNYLNVAFENKTDIWSLENAFSNSASCPWGLEHLGLDLFFSNGTKVIAAAPGQVYWVEPRDFGAEYDWRYTVDVLVRFNQTVFVGYHFESWTNKTSDWLHQQSLIQVKEGDWIVQGQEIGQFLHIGTSGHVHHDIIEDDERLCMKKYFSTDGYNKMMDLIHTYHPTWEMCYIV